MKIILSACILSVLLFFCVGCERKEAIPPQENTANVNISEDMTAREDNAAADTGTSSESTQQKEETETEETKPDSGYIYVKDGLTLKRLDGYTYRNWGAVEHPFYIAKNEADGSVSYFDLNKEWLTYNWMSFRELKIADNMSYWMDGLIDGWLEEYRELSNGVGLSIYLYETRQPFGLSEFETFVPEYGYKAYYGMDGSRYTYNIVFPVTMSFDEVCEFLDSIEIGPEMFANQEKEWWKYDETAKEPKLGELKDDGSRYIMDGLYLTELRDYDYTYIKSNRKLIPFRAVKREGEGAEVEFEMVKELFSSVKTYDELKEAEDIKEWLIGCGIIEGPLVSFQSFDNGVGLSLYEYKTRGEWTETYHKDVFPQYSYIALYGMDGADYVYGIFFPKGLPLEEVEKFLDSLKVGAELFSDIDMSSNAMYNYEKIKNACIAA